MSHSTILDPPAIRRPSVTTSTSRKPLGAEAVAEGETEAKSAARPTRMWVHLALFAATLVTTTAVGARYWDNFSNGLQPVTTMADLLPFPWILEHLDLLYTGLPFSLTLLGILLAHEFGHYFACRLYGVEASLPFLIPAPTLSGTAGAVIRLRSSVKSRSALLVIGAAGPLAGFLVAVPATWFGLIYSVPIGRTTPLPMFWLGAPAGIEFLRLALLHSHPDIPTLHTMIPHPVLLASWVGILVTFINLIPAGQLDGGHILYAISPRLHKLSSQFTIGVLLYLGTVEWVGWLVWAFLLMSPMMRHRQVPDKARPSVWLIALAPISLAVLILSGTLQPVVGDSLMSVLTRINWGFRF